MSQTSIKPEKISRFLSYVLRHAPEEIGIELDAAGWTDVARLIKQAKAAGTVFDRAALDEVVAANDKQRFTLSEDGRKIRAAQGHSIKVDLGLKTIVPPSTLYHGTATRFLDSIYKKGLVSGTRDKVHLSGNYETALTVGKRHGTPIVLQVDVLGLLAVGQSFWMADNGVYLTDAIAADFLMLASIPLVEEDEPPVKTCS